jgi:hypothetical protein
LITSSFSLVRYLLAGGAGIAIVALCAVAFVRLRREASPLTPRRLFLFALIVLVPLSFHHALSPPFDDEAWRLMVVESLLSDLDADLSDEYLEESWRSFRKDGNAFFVEFAAASRIALREDPGSFFPIHAVGFPVVIAPFYAAGGLFGMLGGRWFATIPVVLSGALLLSLLYRVLIAEGLAHRQAVEWSVLFFSCAPILFFSVHLWPEVPAALAGLWVFDRLRRNSGSPGEAAAVAMATCAPSLLHFRYALLALPLFLWALAAYRKSPAALFAYCGSGLCVGLAVIASYSVCFDTHTWRIFHEVGLVHPTTRGQSFFSLAPLLNVPRTIARILAPPTGIVFYAPWLILLATPGVRLKGARPALLTTSLLAFTILISNFESGPLGRYWVTTLPFFLIAATSPTQSEKLFRFVFLISLAKGLIMVFLPVACHDSLLAARLSAELQARFGFRAISEFLFILLA